MPEVGPLLIVAGLKNSVREDDDSSSDDKEKLSPGVISCALISDGAELFQLAIGGKEVLLAGELVGVRAGALLLSSKVNHSMVIFLIG
jgi:hypothetical protein